MREIFYFYLFYDEIFVNLYNFGFWFEFFFIFILFVG
jgi:hypothetical protein